MGIADRVSGIRRDMEEEEELENEADPEIRRLIIRRRIMQRRGRGYMPPPQDTINDRRAFER